MYAFKGGCVGQRFALATYNDPGGKKARIRRSKEERKAMVETFIKKYQNLNNGNFPSLNLTHKEVGGSFYTVREIVREIIQENRVLGPSKLLIEQKNDDNLLEHYPLGSISIEPESCLSLLDETHVISHITSDQDEVSSEDLVESSNGKSFELEHHRLNGELVDCATIETVENYHLEDTPDGQQPNLLSMHHEEIIQEHVQTSDEQQPNLSVQHPGPDHLKLDVELVEKGSLGTDENAESNDLSVENLVSIDHEEFSQEHVQTSNGISRPDFLKLDVELVGKGNLVTDEDEESNKSKVSGLVSVDNEEISQDLVPTSDGQRPNLSVQLPRPDFLKLGKGSLGTDEDEESNESNLGIRVPINHEEICQEHVQESSEDQVLPFAENLQVHGHQISNSHSAVNWASKATEKNNIDNQDMAKGVREQLEPSNAIRTRVKPEIVVEKFPLRSVTKKIDVLEGTSEEQNQVISNLDVNGIEQDRVSVLESATGLMNLEVGADLAHQSLHKMSESIGETANLNVVNSSLGRSKCSGTKLTLEGYIDDVVEPGVKVSSMVEFKNSPKAVHENLDDIKTSVSSVKSSSKSSSNNGSNSTLERIDLETWEGASRKGAESRINNPLVAFIKSVLDAVVKFLNE